MSSCSQSLLCALAYIARKSYRAYMHIHIANHVGRRRTAPHEGFLSHQAQGDDPSHPTTQRHDRVIFGTVRVSSARSKTVIGKPLISIGFATCERGKFGGWFGAKEAGIQPTKKALQILDL